MDIEKILYDISFANIILYANVLPSYNTTKTEDTPTQQSPAVKKGMGFRSFLQAMKSYQ